jgi:hypothetical protein
MQDSIFHGTGLLSEPGSNILLMPEYLFVMQTTEGITAVLSFFRLQVQKLT